MSLSAAIVNKLTLLLRSIGIVLVGFGLYLLLSIYLPIAKEEVSYQLKANISPETQDLTPANTEFSLVIPLLNTTAPIVLDVDPFDSQIYQSALAHGIAHAQGSSLPGEGSNIFLFAHSSASFGLATTYNSVFYLIHKLETGDPIQVWYQGEEYQYQVSQQLIVDSGSINNLEPTPTEQLSLMTCWPPGTTLKRLLVIATPLAP